MSAETLRGLMNLAELDDAVRSGQIDTVIAAIPDMYGRLVGKRFTGQFFLQNVLGLGAFAADCFLVQPSPYRWRY